VKIEKKMLFAPGPVLTSSRVKKAALMHDICHRRPEFEMLYSKVRKNLLRLFNADVKEYTTVVISGSGTASNEAVVSSVVKGNDRVLLVTNGEFGERLRAIYECYKIPLLLIEFGWGQYPDVNRIEETIKKNPGIRLISMVFHETSTGMINPIHDVGLIAKKYGKLYHVDAISAVGGEDVDVRTNKIDLCTGVPNKAVAGHPGVSFVCIKRERIGEITDIPRRNVYLNLQHHIGEAEKHNQTPNTPSVVMMLTLNEALDELFEEGLENRIVRYKKNASVIRRGLKDSNLSLLLTDEKYMSNTVTSAFLPPAVDVHDLVDAMDSEGYVIYLGKGPLLKRNMFQVANMGHIYPRDCKEFIDVLQVVLKKKR